MDPYLLRGALRAAIVAPAVLAVGYHLFDRVLLGLFAWFGAFALLLFVDFDGPPRIRLTAYAGLALAGMPMVILGTMLSGSPWTACAGMAVVAFGVLFAGVINSWLAVAGPALLLAFVLPVTNPGGLSASWERLAGWGLGTGSALVAVSVLWPTSPPDEVRRALAAACRALADCVSQTDSGSDSGSDSGTGPDAGHGGEPGGGPGAPAMAGVVRASVAEVRRRFTATAHRPTGAGGRTAALGQVVVDLNWLVPFVLAVPADPATRRCFPDTSAELRAAVADTLHGAAGQLERYGRPRMSSGRAARPGPGGTGPGGRSHPRLGVERLTRAAAAIDEALLRTVARPVVDGTRPGPAGPGATVAEAFRLRQLALRTRRLALHTLVATAAPRHLPRPAARIRWRRARARLRLAGELAAGYANVRAIWFRDSVRIAAGLTLAVAVTRVTGLQHGFWVVLGTLSVLRSNVVATGRTVLRALAGTAVGIAVGAGAVLLVGTAVPVLWTLLPVAVLIAGYARKANAPAAGQAGFTVAVVLLFNLVEPAGWRIGLVRVEDVVLGFAVSLAVGVLLWPSGAAAALVRERTAVAYRQAADLLVDTAARPPARVESVSATAGPDPAHPPDPSPEAAAGNLGAVESTATATATAARAAVRSGRLLDDAIRHYLAERPAGGLDLDALMLLWAGAQRIRQAAQTVAALGTGPLRPSGHGLGAVSAATTPATNAAVTSPWAGLTGCRPALRRSLAELRGWYRLLADAIEDRDGPHPGPGGDTVDDEIGAARRCALVRVRAALATGDRGTALAALELAERAEYLRVLAGQRGRLHEAARTLAAPVAGPGSAASPPDRCGQAPGPHRSRPALARSRAFIRASCTWRSPPVSRRRTSSSTSTKHR